jgi:adenylate cyclase
MMPYLIEKPKSSQPKIHPLNTGLNRIGRGLDNDIILSHKSLSRHHAVVIVDKNKVILKDLGSLNHTYVNQEVIDQCELREGDLIHYGKLVVEFVWFLDASLFPGTHRFVQLRLRIRQCLRQIQLIFQFSLKTPPVKIESRNAFEAELIAKRTDPAQSRSQPLEIIQGDQGSAPILSRLAPEETRTQLEDLLERNNPDHSPQQTTGLKLRRRDSYTRAVDKLKILLEVSQQLSAPEAPEALLERILNLLFDIMNADRGAILMKDIKTHELKREAVKCRSGISGENQFYSSTIINFVCLNGEGVLTGDACNDRRFNASKSIVLQAIHSSMCVPLKPRNEVIGVLYIDNLSSLNVYSQEDLEFLTALANQAAIAIENAQLYERIQAEAVLKTKLERFFPKTVWKKLKEEGKLEPIDTEVTVVFADISHFTEISSQLEPRQVIDMLNEYFSVMVEGIVFKYEGTLEQYIGDALLAVWGAPYQHPNDAERAVQAAIEMQQALCQLNQDWKERRQLELQIHIGINTGTVAAGNIGSEKLIQYGTIGDTTNVSSRICNVAKSGEILLSQSTVDKLNCHNFSWEKMEPVQVNGKAHPIQLYRLDWTAQSKTWRE